MRHRRYKPIDNQAGIVCIYIILFVVLAVCIGIKVNAQNSGCYYKCDKKIEATLISTNNVHFYRTGVNEPSVQVKSKVYIINVGNEGTTCSIISEGKDPQHTFYAKDVPLSSLSFDRNKLEEVKKIHNCSVSPASYDPTSLGNRLFTVFICALAVFLVVSIAFFIIRKVRYQKAYNNLYE